ncbi:unnamed protein product [Bemisia tabaci]|uniref:Ionotropic glutamate receptor C-terminal domain-containing protein n=1 Tax=Bemisia tabaci TaxID=7038 RepID=A0A9P0AKI3_BEMTA|nr:unnamed protein product [Bemisia tabaci]
MHVVNLDTWGNWFDFHVTAVKYLATSLNSTFKVGAADTPQSWWFDLREEEDGLRCDINLYIFGENGVFLGDSDDLKIDFAVSIDTTAVCVAAPHSTFMSQGLVIFVSFTPIVWALTLITIFVLCFIQYFFQFSQHVLFNELYSEAERDHFRGTSSMLTVYAYFVCGSPPSLISGRVVTGKILFVILSFFALIMSTAFLGSMTTLLSNRVLYAEIDSLKSLEESDLFIETLNALERETDLNFFVDRSESLKAKLVDNHLFYEAEFYDEFDSIGSFETLKTFRNVSLMLSTSNSNAFLVSMPFMSNPKESVIIKSGFREPFEYHLVKECLMMHPLTMPILKNSIFYDKLNQVIAHMLETGHARRILDETSTDAVSWGNSSVREVNDEPRAYDMNDLQSAFIGLGVGLFFSCLAFIGELSIDIFQSSAPVKFFRRMNIS